MTGAQEEHSSDFFTGTEVEALFSIGQAALAAASPQWELSSPRVGCAALLGAEGLELPGRWVGGGGNRTAPAWAMPRLGDRC